MARSAERVQFLTDVLITAVEDGIQYWAEVTEYVPSGDDPHAVIWLPDEDETHRVTLNTIAHGISLLTTGANAKRSFTMSGPEYWAQFKLANRTNGVDGDYDADIADNVLQAGLFDEIVYG